MLFAAIKLNTKRDRTDNGNGKCFKEWKKLQAFHMSSEQRGNPTTEGEAVAVLELNEPHYTPKHIKEPALKKHKTHKGYSFWGSLNITDVYIYIRNMYMFRNIFNVSN